MGAALTTDIATCVPASNSTFTATCLSQKIGSCSLRAIDQCGVNGLCLPDASGINRTICTCILYYDPNVNCSSTYFESLPGDIGYQVVGYIGTIILFILFGLELLANWKNRGWRYCKSLLGVTVLATLFLYIPLNLYALGVRSVSYMSHNARLMATAPIPTLIAVAIVTIFHIITCIEWMNMLIKARNLGIAPTSLKFMRWILLAMAAMVLLAVISGMFIYVQISIDVTYAMGLLSKFATIIGIIIPLVIVIIYSTWTYVSVRKGTKGSHISRKMKMVLRRTTMQVIGSAVSIANAIYLIATPELLYQKVESVMLRDVAGFVYLFLQSLFTWLFLTNYGERFPYQHLDIIRNKKKHRLSVDSSGAPPTEGTGSSGGSGRKDTTTSSSTSPDGAN